MVNGQLGRRVDKLPAGVGEPAAKNHASAAGPVGRDVEGVATYELETYFYSASATCPPRLAPGDGSVDDRFPPSGGDLHRQDLHLPAADGHVAHLPLCESPEHQIGDLIKLEAMSQYHWFGAAARVPR
jgi:hypothetical protein